MRLRFFLAIFLGMDIRATAREQKPITNLKQVFVIDEIWIGRNGQGRAFGDIRYSTTVHSPHCMRGVLIIDQMKISNNSNDRAGHDILSFRLLGTPLGKICYSNL